MMRLKNMVVLVLVVILAAALVGPATAGKKKKAKKPKPYKSEEGVIAVAHTLLISSTGERNNVTLREFENRCAFPPATNGFDAFVYEVPAAYQKIESTVAARADASVAWDLYLIMYDKDCGFVTAISATGSVTQADAEGVMPKGIAYVGIANFAGEPATVWWEAKP